uniref:Cell number regulator 1 n=1 Tax=Vitis vinifera TaxID=29760 RepID=A5BI59_VITVI|nr:hypothetical protein VITISV_021221 [Vitis vinifera]
MYHGHSDHEKYGAGGHVGHATAPGFQNPSPAPPPRYAAPYVVQYPGGTIRWSSGLCHCCDDPANFLITCVCPCITFGQIAEIVSKGSSNCAVSGTIYTVLCFIGLPCLYSCVYRSRLRAQYDLEESPCVDCLVHFFCEACSLCQEYRELKSRGFDMGIGWEANADRQRRGITVPPAVASRHEQMKSALVALQICGSVDVVTCLLGLNLIFGCRHCAAVCVLLRLVFPIFNSVEQ